MNEISSEQSVTNALISAGEKYAQSIHELDLMLESIITTEEAEKFNHLDTEEATMSFLYMNIGISAYILGADKKINQKEIDTFLNLFGELLDDMTPESILDFVKQSTEDIDKRGKDADLFNSYSVFMNRFFCWADLCKNSKLVDYKLNELYELNNLLIFSALRFSIECILADDEVNDNEKEAIKNIAKIFLEIYTSHLSSSKKEDIDKLANTIIDKVFEIIE